MANIPIYIPTYINSVDYTPAKVQPRLLFYNGMLDCETYYIESASVLGGIAREQNAFPYFDNYNVVTGSFPTVDSKSLLFYNEEAVYGQTPTDTLYSDYWDTYVELLYNPRTKLLNASAIIPLADYFKISQNDIIEFRGNYYHLRAINDYNLSNGECSLQLLGPILPESLNLPTSTTTTTVAPGCLFTFNAYDSSALIVEVNITGSNYSVNLPARTTSTLAGPFNYLYTASWGDGTSSYVSGSAQAVQSHTYVNPGTYNITINGLFEAWDTGIVSGQLANAGPMRPIMSKVNNWGSVGLKLFNIARCTELAPYPFPNGGQPGMYNLKNINGFLDFANATGSTLYEIQQVTLPNNLLDYSVNLETANTFAAGPILEVIPEYLFKGTPNLHSAVRAFINSSYLIELPNKMFPNNMYFVQKPNYAPHTLNLQEMFVNITGVPIDDGFLIPPNLFDEITGSKDLKLTEIFRRTVPPIDGYGGISGSAYEFWNSPSASLWPYADTKEAYKNQVSASNYASIPPAYL